MCRSASKTASRAPSGNSVAAMTRRREPAHASSALARLIESAQPQNVLAKVQREWAAAVGPTVAQWTRPVSESAGVVAVECSDAVVAHELEMMKPQLIRQLVDILGDAAPRDLRFRVGDGI